MKSFATQEDYQTAYDAALFQLELARDQYGLRIINEDLRRVAMAIVDAVAKSDIEVTGDIADLPGVKVEREE